MFRKLGEDNIVWVGVDCSGFEELKKMNVMIHEIHEKMWTEMYRPWEEDIVLADVSDYKVIELLDNYYVFYICGYDEVNEFDKLYKESIEEKINEYTGINNKKTLS
jgi:hypothetical protein